MTIQLTRDQKKAIQLELIRLGDLLRECEDACVYSLTIEKILKLKEILTNESIEL